VSDNRTIGVELEMRNSSIAFEFIRLMRNDSVSSGVAEFRNDLSAMVAAICALNSSSVEKTLSFAINGSLKLSSWSVSASTLEWGFWKLALPNRTALRNLGTRKPGDRHHHSPKREGF
jgi:hypothetical protein